jgi:hypothetical protein
LPSNLERWPGDWTVLRPSLTPKAYPEEYLREKQRDFLNAGREVDFVSIQGAPHFANVTHAREINPLLAKFVRERSDLQMWKGEVDRESPFHERLWSFEVEGGEDEEEDSDEE